MKRMLHNFLLSTNKNSTSFFLKPALCFMAAVLCFGHAEAQKKKKPSAVNSNRPASQMKRCGTMEGIELQMQTDPELRARVEQNERDFQNWLANGNSDAQRPSSPTALPDSVVIPVVVHIVLPNPWIITDEAIDVFFARLNDDFAGRNADSANCAGGNFCALRGHSVLRFTRAKRDPQGRFTTGVIRVIGTTQIQGGNPQPIKNSNTATGGSTGWDITKYYNIYVGDGGASGLLGISPTIGPGTAAGTTNADGVCLDYRAFGNLCFSYDEYKLSRTAVHEIGHNFGLYHIWGDGNTCVNGADFRQLASTGCSLPNNLLSSSDDTPNASGSTSGCPGGAISNGCTNPVPRMYQNYMDYTDDACYSMFTNGQVARMHYVLENCRNGGYLTTLGGQYPSSVQPLDAAPTYVVSPGGAEANPVEPSCDINGVKYPAQTCPGSFTPRLRIMNAGTTILRSVTVTTTVNGLNPVVETVALNNLANGKSQNVSLGVQNAVAGVNVLRFVLSDPNGGVDGNPGNDTLTYTFNTGAPLNIPFTENFASATFPPNNGSLVINPDGDVTWERATVGRPAPGSMKMDFYNYSAIGERDIFSMPPIVTERYDSVKVSFYVAYQRYQDASTPATNDSLIIVYSSDCGATWKRTNFAKGGATLETVAPSDQDYTPAGTAQWRKETVTLKDFCANGVKNLRIGFQSYNDFGNNLYVDSITIVGFAGQTSNTALQSIVDPLPAICSNNFVPRVAFTNLASDSTKSLTIKYVLDHGVDTVTYQWTGALGKCDRAVASLPAASVQNGAHVLEVFTYNPNGIADQNTANDYLLKNFTVITNENMPVTQGFETNVFPPANWGVYDVNGGTTWERNTTASLSGAGALLMNNPNTANNNNAVDYFISPIVNGNSANDSVFVSFDMAYKSGANYPGSTVFPLDTLEVLITTDCGASFTSVWKKWGDALQTINDPNYTYTTPFIPKRPVNAGEWRSEKVYLTPYVNDNDFQVYFTMKGNKQNNMWIDNINIYGQILPARLKYQGYLIYPNPFTSTFLIHHSAVEPPVDLQSVVVYNAAGQQVWSKQFNGNAARQITVDLKGQSNGIYVLKMIYSNRTVIERIVKAQ